MSDEHYDKNTLALIGAIIAVWASIEKQVAGAVRWIEVGEPEAAKSKYANYVDLSKFRSFKERKGHLRKLVEPNRVRHSLCHDLIYPGPNGNIFITQIGNIAKGESIETILTTSSCLKETLQDRKLLTRSITAIGTAIYRRLESSSK